MTRVWVTTGSTTVEAVVNPVAAACEEGFVPDVVHMLENPGLAGTFDRTRDLIETVVEVYGGDPAVEVTDLESETDFGTIVDYFRDAIEAAEADDTVAVDITPGRKFMSAIAFQAGIRFGADHAYYLYLDSGRYHGRVYPDIPRTAVELVDFTEVF